MSEPRSIYVFPVLPGTELPAGIWFYVRSHEAPEEAVAHFRNKYHVEPGRVYTLRKMVLMELVEEQQT